MKILAFDTSTHACTVAVSHDAQVLWRHEIMPNQQTKVILPMIEALLTEAGLVLADVDAIAFGCGPGSFTGVRIAASVAQALGFGVGRGVIPISTLQTLAMGAYRMRQNASVLASWDARMGEVYWGQYVYDADQEIMLPLAPDALSAPDAVDIVASGTPWVGVGNAWECYHDALKARMVETNQKLADIIEKTYPHARDMIPLAQAYFLQKGTIPADQAQPIYLRNPRFA